MTQPVYAYRTYIRATLDDIALANRLAPELLGRSLDELPPQTRRFLELVVDAERTLEGAWLCGGEDGHVVRLAVDGGEVARL